MEMMTTKAAQAAEARRETRERLIDAGLVEAERTNFATMRREDVAKAVTMSPAIVNHAFGTMEEYRHAVMVEAVERRNHIVIAQGLMARHPVALGVHPDLKAVALLALA